MEAADEFRLLMPSLTTYELPYGEDGGEGRIPLLGRILAVISVLAFENGQPLIDDPNRFDPEIVAAIGELEDAA
jgi:hypothetical protein